MGARKDNRQWPKRGLKAPTLRAVAVGLVEVAKESWLQRRIRGIFLELIFC